MNYSIISGFTSESLKKSCFGVEVKDRLRNFLMGHLVKNRDMLLNEAKQISGFMKLLMKERNAEGRWSAAEKIQLKKYILRVVSYVPLFCIFLLPGGLLLIPLLAEAMDRRKNPRISTSGQKPSETVSRA